VDVNQRGIYVNGFNTTWERTPLMLAGQHGFTELVDLLLAKGAEANARDRIDGSLLDRGNTALILAAAGDHLETVQALCNHAKKLDLNLRNRDGACALWMGAANENLEMVTFLQGKGAKVNNPNQAGRSLLTTTFMHKKFEVLDFLVAKGADVNQADRTGCTPLMTAILSNHTKRDLVLRWLEHFLTCKPKLDLQPVNADGGAESALSLASRFGFLDAITLLLDHGATLNLASLPDGRTPLATAALSKQVEAARLLLKRGAKAELADKAAYTPLLLAVLQADADMVQALLEGGALPDVKAPGHFFTPLVAAAGNLDPFKHSKCMKIIKLLLEGKADPNFQAGDGRTALSAAAASTDQGQGLDTASLLLDRGAKVDVANAKGETPLMLAAGNGNEKMVKLLLKKDANVQLTSGAGETAMNFALRSGQRGVVALLEAKGAKAGTPAAQPKVVVKELIGTWVGQQDGMPQAVFNLTLKKDNTFDFVSRFTPEALKKLPKGAVNPVIAAQKGTYTLTSDVLVLNVTGAAPFTRHWKLVGGMLILDDLIRLKRTK
jgi:ankyrin repeat protein